MDNIIVWWALPSNFEYDVPSWAWLLQRPSKPPYTFFDRKIQYNQSIYDPFWCTRYGGITLIANSRWIDITKEDRDWFRSNAANYWWINRYWMYTSKAWDMIVDRFNTKFPDQNWVKESINTYGSEDIIELLKSRWMLHMSSMINKRYTNDSQDDWVINWPRWIDWQWHSRCFVWLWYWVWIVENYVEVPWVNAWLKYNIIDLQEFKLMLEAKQFHNSVFIYYPTSNMQTPIPYPYMTIEEAENLEKITKTVIPWLVSDSLSETVRAWVDAANSWVFAQTDDKSVVRYLFRNYTGIDWVAKMTIDLSQIR